ncbi:MAG: PilZ domain-containing protein [Bryobacteraceae bacterium]
MMRNADKPNERRSKRRFPIHREVRYTILMDGQPVATGTGLTLDVSSRGVRFAADRPLPVGAAIEIVISWPATPEDRCPLQLVGRGWSIRSKGAWVACRIEKFEFRTMSQAVMVERAFAAAAFAG